MYPTHLLFIILFWPIVIIILLLFFLLILGAAIQSKPHRVLAIRHACASQQTCTPWSGNQDTIDVDVLI